MEMKNVTITFMAVIVGVTCWAAYDVRQPSEYLRPTYAASDTEPGRWSLNVQDVMEKAKVEIT